jgi:hypothetical protein
MKLIIICVLLSLFVWNGSNANNQAAPPLRLKLTTTTPALCFGASLKVEAELVNESKEKVAIDVKTIWHQVSFKLFRSGPSRTNPDGGGSGRNTGGSKTIVGDTGPNYEGEYLILSPGESYKASRTIKLDDEFFNSPGTYSMKVSYGQFLDKSLEGITVWKGSVESNILNFKVTSCKNKKALASK